MKLYIGYDIGSISVNRAVLDENKKLIDVLPYTRHFGKPINIVREDLKSLTNKYSDTQIACMGVTGSGRELLSQLTGMRSMNELHAQAIAVRHLHPEAKTVIEIGGEDSKYIDPVTQDYAMNELCAAGTGSFLDQQASRLGLSIEEFGDLALKSENPPRIAGRCSVFAKTDMIHLQQEATPVHDIAAGLCHALARNFRSSIAKGKKFVPPVAFQGGVAFNKGMISAFESFFGEKLIIPESPASMGAIGVALTLLSDSSQSQENVDLTRMVNALDKHLKSSQYEGKTLKRLAQPRAGLPLLEKERYDFGNGKVDAFLGVDVGSISTNVVAIDRNKRLIAKCYLMTAGRPIEAVREGMRKINQQVGKHIRVVGVGTTGSGRYLTGDFVGADIVINEITAQATAAADYDRSVDTIFEIGGQDSKFISLKDGVVVDFEMNKVCAAGTGSFLEEQAERLEVKIEEFGDIALESENPLDLGERCTVFMETNLALLQQKGAEKSNLLGGLAYSIATNYLNRVVEKKTIGNKVFFQGAVAFNKAVVAAFESILDKEIIVPPNHHVTGAIGTAIAALERSAGKTAFRGFDAIEATDYKITSFECDGCSNACEVRKVVIENEQPLFYGGRCEKYEKKEDKLARKDIPDFFAEREKFLLSSRIKGKGKKVGIPYAMMMHEFYPFWKTFFSTLGFEVVLSDKSSKKIIHEGVESAVAETCFPIKITLGHVHNLLEKGVDYLFLPSIIDMPPPKGMERSFSCPYVQEIPHIVKAAIDLDTPILYPVIHLRLKEYLDRELLELGKDLGKKAAKVRRSITMAHSAQEKFYSSLQERGREVMDSIGKDERALVVLGRPYNTCDRGISLEIPKKLRDLGLKTIPLDYLPLDSVDISKDHPSMYWKYGHKILTAARIVKSDPRLNAVYITNFGCGPDSFITQFFEKEMQGKPYLKIEVDEHSADVGIITRCEAFLDSLKNVKQSKHRTQKKKAPVFKRSDNRIVYIPHMSDGAFVLQAVFSAQGIPAEVLLSDDETLALGRKHTLGKECYPCIITTGDMLKTLKYNDPKKVAFFMPTTMGPCRFGQYNKLQRMILDRLGYSDVPIMSPFAPETKEFYEEYNTGILGGIKVLLKSMQGLIAFDHLDKMVRQTRPYEINRGEADKVYDKHLKKICEAMGRNRQKTLSVIAKNLAEAAVEFAQVSTNRENRPRIGIVGEIFVRNHCFSNNNIVRRVEELGGEVLLPPLIEWAFHTNATRRSDSIMAQKYLFNKAMRSITPGSTHKDARSLIAKLLQERLFYILNGIFNRTVSRYEHRLAVQTTNFLKGWEDAEIYETWDNAEPYIIKWFGEAALSIGKSVDWAKNGANGIINVLPFTCLPGTIATAVSKRVKEDYSIPWLNLSFDGLEQATTETRIETFMYQAARHKSSNPK
jgi:predicted CoA-substrate-specific enzyme activase